MNTLLKNKYAQWFLILFIGVTIGAIFYPTKTIEERVKKEYQSKIDKAEKEKMQIINRTIESVNHAKKTHLEYREESQKKMFKLQTKIVNLQAKSKEVKYRLVKPDGTIEEKTYRESEINQTSKVVTEVREEFNRKVSSIEKKWSSAYKKRLTMVKETHDKEIREKEEIISKYEKYKKVEINKKKFGVALGMMSDKDYFTNISYDIFGPVFLDLQIESNFGLSNSTGLGIGLRF